MGEREREDNFHCKKPKGLSKEVKGANSCSFSRDKNRSTGTELHAQFKSDNFLSAGRVLGSLES